MRRPWSTRADRRAELLELLAKNDEAEDFHFRVMAYQGVGVDAVNQHLTAILEVRRERVEILRRLGWRKEADELAADTSVRAEWGPVKPWGLS